MLSIVITRRYFFLDPERIVEISFSLPLAPLCHFQFVIRWITFIFDSIERIGRENRENCYSSKISYDKSFHQNIKKKIFDFNVRNFHFRSKGTASRRAYKVGEMCLENKDTDCAYLQEGTCSRNLIAGLACFALVSWFSRARACVCVCARIETWPRRRITGGSREEAGLRLNN